MNGGFFLSALFNTLSGPNTKIPYALYGPCEYWQAWYDPLSSEKKSLIYPYHQPLGSVLSIETLLQRSYALCVTTNPIHLLPKSFMQFEEPVALWYYHPQNQTIFVTLSVFPLSMLKLEEWLILYEIAKNLKKIIFIQKESKIYLAPIETGSPQTQHFLSLKSELEIAPSLQLNSMSTVLMEPLSFQTLLTCMKETQPMLTKPQFSWFQKKESKKILYLQGVAQKRSVYAYTSASEASELIPVIEWAFAALS